MHSAPYKPGPTAREYAATEIDIMLKLDIMKPTRTVWARPIVFVPKKDRVLRFVVN